MKNDAKPQTLKPICLKYTKHFVSTPNAKFTWLAKNVVRLHCLLCMSMCLLLQFLLRSINLSQLNIIVQWRWKCLVQKLISCHSCSLWCMTLWNISEYNAAYCSGFLLLQPFLSKDFLYKLWFDDDFKCGPLDGSLYNLVLLQNC